MRHFAAFLGVVFLPGLILQKLDQNTLNWVLKITSNSSEDNQNQKNTATTASPVTLPSSTISSRFDATIDSETELNFTDAKPCETVDGKNGLCVMYHQCLEGLIDNTTLIDLRDASCPHYLIKCCAISDTIVRPTEPPPAAQKNTCGWGNSGSSIFRTSDQSNINKITYADFGEYPWAIALIKKGGDPTKWSQRFYLGGGTLIHPSVVITAAHKVNRYKSNQIICRAGEWDTETTLELFPHQDRDVKKIITHEQLILAAALNDVSMLIMKTPFDLENSPHIGIACLSPRPPVVGTACFGVGWGSEVGNKSSYANILKKVEVPIVEFNQCQDALRKTRLSSRFNLHQSHLCAGGDAGVDLCRGDGGSPLMCPIEEGVLDVRYAVYGMVAFGVGCGENNTPGVYVNIPDMYSWIDSKMRLESFDQSSYKYSEPSV